MAIVAVAIAATGLASAQEPQPTVELRRQAINIRIEKAPLVEVLSTIEAVSGITVLYADDLPDPLPDDPMTLVFTNAMLKDVLEFVVKVNRLTYKVIDPKTIRIEKKDP